MSPDGELNLYLGETLRYTFSFEDYLTRNGLSGVSIASSLSQASMATIGNEALNNGLYSWTLTGVSAGRTNMQITLTTSDVGRKPIAVIEINVFDPADV